MTTETELVTNGLVYHLCSLHSFGFVSVFGEMELSVLRGKCRKWQGSDCLQQDVELALEWDVGLVGLDGVIRRKKNKEKKTGFLLLDYKSWCQSQQFWSREFFSMMSPQF